MKFFGFDSSTPRPPRPPLRPPAPPLRSSLAKRPPVVKPRPTPGIVGRWQEPGASDTTEFRADGSLIERLATGETIPGRYFLENGKLRVKLDGVDDLSFAVSVTAESLELTDSNGAVTRYRRA